MACIDREMLSMYLDDELDDQTRLAVEDQLSRCDHCVGRLQSLQAHDTVLKETLAAETVTNPRHCDDVNPEQLCAYVSQELSAEARAEVDRHLQTCMACLGEVMAIRQVMRLQQQAPLMAPPERLVRRVRQNIMANASRVPRAASMVEHLGTLVFQVARDGLRFVESLMLPEHVQLTFASQAVPVGSLRHTRRNADAAALIDVHEKLGDLDLFLQVAHEEATTVLVRVRLQKFGQALRRHRVALIHDGRTQASHTTSGDGEVHFPRLYPGVYTIRVPQAHIEVGLNLQ